jgi:hypothetical protein
LDTSTLSLSFPLVTCSASIRPEFNSHDRAAVRDSDAACPPKKERPT